MVAFRTVMLVQMWGKEKFEIVVTLREARGGRFPQCNAGADWAEGSRGARFSQCWCRCGGGMRGAMRGSKVCLSARYCCVRCGTCKHHDRSCDMKLVRCGAGTDANLKMQKQGEEKAK